MTATKSEQKYTLIYTRMLKISKKVDESIKDYLRGRSFALLCSQSGTILSNLTTDATYFFNIT